MGAIVRFGPYDSYGIIPTMSSPTISSRKLSPTSYLVLGLVAQHGPVTPYDLKGIVQKSIGNFWSFPHSQLYAEPERLARDGLLHQRQEPGGRRRRLFTITDEGSEALSAWLEEPVQTTTEIRDLGVLKLFFGSLTPPARVTALAQEQREQHAARHAEYQAMQQALGDAPDPHMATTLELGLRFEAMVIEFWEGVARRPAARRRARGRSGTG